MAQERTKENSMAGELENCTTGEGEERQRVAQERTIEKRTAGGWAISLGGCVFLKYRLPDHHQLRMNIIWLV